jgi:hypothetical protein
MLVWEPVPMASTYEVWRFQPRQNPTRIYLGAGTSYTDIVGSGDTCYYAVRAVGGAFGELRRVITGPRPCLQIREILPKDGQIHLTSSGQWWDPVPEAFYLHPLGLHPVAAIGSGGSLALYFGQPLPPASYALLIDTLLLDAYSRFLNPDCDTLPFTIPSNTDTLCLLPLRWEIVGDTFVDITFSASLPPKADTLSYYQLFPVGQVTHLQRLSDTQLRLTLSVSPHRQPLSLTWSWDTASFCPHTIAFYPAAQTLSNWGFFPQPRPRASPPLLLGPSPQNHRLYSFSKWCPLYPLSYGTRYSPSLLEPARPCGETHSTRPLPDSYRVRRPESLGEALRGRMSSSPSRLFGAWPRSAVSRLRTIVLS